MKKVLFIEFYGSVVKVGKDRYYDLTPNFEVWHAIKNIHPDYVFIMENDPCEQRRDARDTDFKYEYFKRALCKFLNSEDIFVEYSYCPFDDTANEFRKPNSAMYGRMMWKYAECDFNDPFGNENVNCLCVGGDDDRQVAESIGCKYLSTEDFLAVFNQLNKAK